MALYPMAVRLLLREGRSVTPVSRADIQSQCSSNDTAAPIHQYSVPQIPADQLFCSKNSMYPLLLLENISQILVKSYYNEAEETSSRLIRRAENGKAIVFN
jgi:hypothetical protein